MICRKLRAIIIKAGIPLSEATFYRSMLDNFYEGVYFVDTERKITFWNKGAERITGFSAEEILGKHCFDNILNHVDDEGNALCHDGCPLHKSIQDGQARESAVYLHHKAGQRVKVFVRTTPLFELEQIIGAVEVFVDDSEKATLVSNLEKLKQLAMYDQLTKMPNRRYVESYLKAHVNEYHHLGLPLGLAFIDIDHFKHFNDTYGHETGDRVLQMMAKTYQSAVRKGDVVARWGGEEFIAVFPTIDTDGLKQVTEKLRMLVEKSVLRESGQELSVTVSIGAALITPEDTVDSLIHRADQLMYQSKQGGRNRVTSG